MKRGQVYRTSGGSDRDAGGYYRSPSCEKGYRVIVTGLPRDTSWQDLKDFGRTAGSSVCFTDVYMKYGKVCTRANNTKANFYSQI